jgi:hypothetical protein
MKIGKIYLVVFLCLFSIAGLINMAIAWPSGAETITEQSSERMPYQTADSTEAQAGNISEVTISGVTISRHFAGFYGNVSGTIVLSDANNNTMYDWSVTSPTGQVYAVRSGTVQWDDVTCAQVTHKETEDTVFLGMNISYLADRDSVNRTFINTTNHPTFYVGSTEITNHTCHAANTYVNSGSQTSSFFEILLYDFTNSNMVYTTILEEDVNGFDNNAHDFQILLAEPGDGTDTSTTTYWFYLEIE